MGNPVQRECPVCGDTYTADENRLRHGRQTTCSRACSYRLRSDKKERGQSFECAVCGQQFTRTPSKIKAKHGAVFCSPECHYAGRSLGLTKRVVTRPYVISDSARAAWRAGAAKAVATRRARDNYRQSDATRRRLSETTARAIAEGRIPSVSQLEDEVAEVLDSLGLVYSRQVSIRGKGGRYAACVDFLLADGRALEVNGTFWHSDPVVYPEGPVYPSQIRSAERWQRKVEALDALSIPLVVVWEREFRNDPTEAVRIALATV